MGAVCGICMALSVIAEELISKPGRKQATDEVASEDGDPEQAAMALFASGSN